VQCTEHASITDPVSINNSGEVLVATGTGRGCVYKSSYDFAAAPHGGLANDECLGIGYWKPGLKAIVFLRPIGRNPQWLSAETAALLLAWRARTGGPDHN
jgi:hypothetical protein